MLILVYDWEIFKHDSLLGILNIEKDEVVQLWNIEDIKKYIRHNLDEIWIGYNSDKYDKILSHGVMMGILKTESDLFKCSNEIIHAQDYDTPLFNVLGKLGINDYYQSPILSYDLLRRWSILFS